MLTVRAALGSAVRIFRVIAAAEQRELTATIRPATWSSVENGKGTLKSLERCLAALGVPEDELFRVAWVVVRRDAIGQPVQIPKRLITRNVGQIRELQRAARLNAVQKGLAMTDDGESDPSNRRDGQPVPNATEVTVMGDDVIAAAAVFARRRLAGNREHEMEWASRACKFAEEIWARRSPQSGTAPEAPT